MKKRSVKWWMRNIVHNVVIHPLLPLADLYKERHPANRFSRIVEILHDHSAPADD